MKRLAIIGSAASGGAAQIIEALQYQQVYTVVCILDNNEALRGKRIFNIEVTGSTESVLDKWNKKEFDEVAIAIGGDLKERKRLYDFFSREEIPLANVIDPTVKLGLGVKMGKGNVILNNSYLGNNVVLGNNNYILNQCSFQHDTVIGDTNYFATNVSIGALVTIGSLNRFGIKSIIETRGKVFDDEVIEALKVVHSK